MSNFAGLIETFAAQGGALSTWSAGLSREQLLATPATGAGAWSMYTLIVHMLDSDLAATHRMRRIVAEETPLLIAYDETLFAQRCQYASADLKQVCELFAMNRAFTSAWLKTVPVSEFARVGVHNQRGKVTLEDMLKIYIEHVTHHEKFAMAKLRAFAK